MASEEFSNLPAAISATSGVALVGAVGIGVGLQVSTAFVLLILGLLLSYVIVVWSSIRIWRLTSTGAHPVDAPSSSRSAEGPSLSR